VNLQRLEKPGLIERTRLNPIPKTEAAQSIESAEQFVNEILKRLEGAIGQKKLF
jgi:hypothetical protein